MKWKLDNSERLIELENRLEEVTQDYCQLSNKYIRVLLKKDDEQRELAVAKEDLEAAHEELEFARKAKESADKSWDQLVTLLIEYQVYPIRVFDKWTLDFGPSKKLLARYGSDHLLDELIRRGEERLAEQCRAETAKRIKEQLGLCQTQKE